MSVMTIAVVLILFLAKKDLVQMLTKRVGIPQLHFIALVDESTYFWVNSARKIYYRCQSYRVINALTQSHFTVGKKYIVPLTQVSF